ncbi:MAG: tetratricopeptide repeat protein [Acidobacteria bacterium]|nr:tetratricopeptide repeat protein [Acidobacteriota bacterium]
MATVLESSSHMKDRFSISRTLAAASLLTATLTSFITTPAQDLVPVSSLTGGSSVFIIRARASARRAGTSTKPTRTRAQQLETTAKIKKQYENQQARLVVKPNRAKVVDPNKLPPNPAKTLPPARASKLFAGVGEYYIARGDFEQSFDFFRDAINLDDRNLDAKHGYSEALAMKGNDLLVKDQAATAKGVFLEAVKYDPANAAALFGLGEVYSELDQPTEAIAAYEKSLASDKDLTEIYVPLGILYYQAGDIAKADDLLAKALAKSSGTPETYFYLGLVRYAQNRNDEALAAFRKAKDLDPNYAEAYFYSGETLLRVNRVDDAIAEYQKAIQLKTGYFDALLALGQAQITVKHYSDAITALLAAQKLKNDNWEVYAALGDANREVPNFNDAEANYNLAAVFYTRLPDFNKETAADFYRKAALMIGQQCDINMKKFIPCRWPSAIGSLQKAIALTDDPIDYVNLGWAYFRTAHPYAEAKNLAAAKPDLDSAKAALDHAVSTGNASVVDFALQNMGAVQIDLGDFAGAIATLNKRLGTHPDDPVMRYQLGVAYFKNNDLTNAEKAFRDALKRDPKYVFALVGLGETMLSKKNSKELRKVIDQLKLIDPQAAADLEFKAKAARLPI